MDTNDLWNSVFKNKQATYRRTFATEDGKDVLKDLLSFCKFTESCYVPGDPTGTAYNEGMRRVALRLMSFLNKEIKEEMTTNLYNQKQ